MHKHIIISLFLIFWGAFLFGQLSEGGLPIEIEQLKSVHNSRKTVVMPKFDLVKAQQQAPSFDYEKGGKFAHAFDVNLTSDNSGQWFQTETERIWQLSIQSVDALSLHVIFTKYFVPEGARLFLFDENKETVYGAYTSKNNKDYKKLAIYPFPGEKVIIQYEEPLNAAFKGELVIGKVSHDYIGVVNLKNRWNKRPSGLCNVNVGCETGINTELLKRSVCRVFAVDELGTATLLNNTSEDGKPIIISAFHVFDNNENAELSLYDFNYESPFCTTIDGYDMQTVSGSKALASFDSLDFMLAELSEMPPASYRPYYVGWDATGKIPSSAFTIHHPNGDVMKITKDTGVCDTISFTKSFIRFGHWKVLNWESGSTEAGSSGSALIGSNNRVFGTLSGGEASCDKLSYDAFSRINRMWNYRKDKDKQLKVWLDPAGKGSLILDGFDPYEAKFSTCTLVTNFLKEDILIAQDAKLNISSISEVAERFDQTDYASLSGVAIAIKSVVKKTTNPEITIRIYSGEENPDFAEKQFKYPFNGITNNAMNYFSFGEEVEIKGTFYISVLLDTNGDKVNLLQSDFRAVQESNSMLLKEKGVWKTVSDYSTEGFGASLLMQVNLCSASFIQAVDSTNDALRLMKCYPNPAINYLIVDFIEKKLENEITIYDMAGRMFYNECFTNRAYTEIDLSGFAPGIYLVNLKSNKQSETQRIVVL